MEVNGLVIRGNTIKAEFVMQKVLVRYSEQLSPEYKLRGAAILQVKSINMAEITLWFMKLTKIRVNDKSEYRMRPKLDYSNDFQRSLWSDGIWHLVKEGKYESRLSVHVSIEVGTRGSWFSVLYRETATTDFKLKGIDGAVPVHRGALAAASPFLHAMLSGPWRESTEGTVKISSATLGLFKEFIYKGKLPEVTRERLEPLMLLASLYLMPELEQLCVDRLMKCVDDTTAVDLLEFAVENKMTRLAMSLLDCVQSKKVVDVNTIYRNFNEKLEINKV